MKKYISKKIKAILKTFILSIAVVAMAFPAVYAQMTYSHFAFQVGNDLVIDQELAVSLSSDAKSTPVYRTGQEVMIPLNWLCKELELETTQRDNEIYLSGVMDKTKEIRLSLTIQEGAAFQETKNGVLYVSAKSMAGLGWQLVQTNAANGDYLLLTNEPQKWTPSTEYLLNAANLLGPSREQVVTGGFLFKVGSDYFVKDGKQAQLLGTDGKTSFAPLTEKEKVYLPLEAVVVAMGGQIISQKDQTYTISYSGKQAVLTSGSVLVDGKKTENAEYLFYTDKKGIVYTTPKTLELVFDLIASSPDKTTVALTKMDLSSYQNQLAYLVSLCAVLPAKPPESVVQPKVEKAKEEKTTEKKPEKKEIPKAKAYVALTFDDGPTGSGTDGRTARLLDGLKARSAHATFFMCGYRIKSYNSHMSRLLAEGHELGNHTMDHPGVLTKYSASEIAKQVTGASSLIEKYAGQKPNVMRPVGGAYNSTVLNEMKKLGLPVINWSVDTNDWKYRDAKHVKNVIVNQAKDGDIILMHDLYETSVQGALQAIDILKQRGYAFVTVEELAEIKGVKMEPGKLYTHF